MKLSRRAGARNQSGKSCRRAKVSAVCSLPLLSCICSTIRAYTSDSARVKLGRCICVPVRVLLIDDSKAVVRELRSLLSLNPGWLVCGEGIKRS